MPIGLYTKLWNQVEVSANTPKEINPQKLNALMKILK